MRAAQIATRNLLVLDPFSKAMKLLVEKLMKQKSTNLLGTRKVTGRTLHQLQRGVLWKKQMYLAWEKAWLGE